MADLTGVHLASHLAHQSAIALDFQMADHSVVHSVVRSVVQMVHQKDLRMALLTVSQMETLRVDQLAG